MNKTILVLCLLFFILGCEESAYTKSGYLKDDDGTCYTIKIRYSKKTDNVTNMWTRQKVPCSQAKYMKDSLGTEKLVFIGFDEESKVIPKNKYGFDY